jgi:hypothetical protein
VRRAGDDQVVKRGATRRPRRLRPERARPARYSSRTLFRIGAKALEVRASYGQRACRRRRARSGRRRGSTLPPTGGLPPAQRHAGARLSRGHATELVAPIGDGVAGPRRSDPPPAKPRRTPPPARPRRTWERPASAGAARLAALPDLGFRNDIGALGGIDRGIGYALAAWGSQRKWRLAIKRPAKPHSARDATSPPTRPMPPPETSEV